MPQPVASGADTIPPQSAPREPYVVGTVVAGKYRLEARMGEGGMGTIWLALNLTLDAPVALKLIHSPLQNEETVERLLLEARVEARLKHPNIVRVFDFGRTDSGDAFVVMEALEGITLGKLMESRGRLPAVEAVQMLLPLIDALAHAHQAGVAHRDLKPENIFLDRSGPRASPKLLDFGVAKLLREDRLHRTEGGLLVGSPAYMSPEQAQGADDVDHRVDIWAVCVVLYETISGEAAFPGEGYEVLRRVVEDALAPLQQLGAADGALSRIIARGLEKNRAERFQSMRELGSSLAQWLYDQGEREDFELNAISRTWPVVARPAASSTPDCAEEPVGSSEQPYARPRRDARAIRIVPIAHSEGMLARARRRVAIAQRTLLAAFTATAIVFIPTKLRVEKTSHPHLVVARAAVAARSGATDSAPPQRAEAPELGVTLTNATAVATTDSSEKQESVEPKRPRQPRTEAELGLKVPY